MHNIPWHWLFWIAITFVAIKVLIVQSQSLSEALKEKLIDHVRSEFDSAKQRKNIEKVQQRLRAMKEKQSSEDASPDDQAAEQSPRRAA